jgi:ubiquinone/menaquinone biosynthesis C-methylase UbiE
MITEKQFETLAGQLCHPHGVMGRMVASHMNKGNLRMNLETIAQIQPKPYEHILEIGMGNGFYVKDVLSQNKLIRYFGIDFSITMVDESIMLNNRFVQNGQALFIQANASNLPFINEFFDTVFTVNTIYFWKDIRIVFSEVRRVLKTNGTFVLSLRPSSVMGKLPITKYGFKTFSIENITGLLRSNGFTPIKVTERRDTAITFNDHTFENAFIIVKAKKTR